MNIATKSETEAIGKLTKRILSSNTLGGSIDTLYRLKQEKSKAEEKVKAITEQIAVAQEKVFASLDAQETTKGAGILASASISSITVATVQDWETFYAFIYKKKFGHLLQQRVSDPAYRELMERGMLVPGVSPFTKRSLNVRVLT